jgi:predicted metal-dependent enzyme (double-stranded beta helix superfamily)
MTATEKDVLQAGALAWAKEHASHSLSVGKIEESIQFLLSRFQREIESLGAACIREKKGGLPILHDPAVNLSVFLLGFRPGSYTSIHGHGQSIGAMHVIHGRLLEVIPTIIAPHGGEVLQVRSWDEIVHQNGQTVHIPEGHIHFVRTQNSACSLHVYSPFLQEEAMDLVDQYSLKKKSPDEKK